MLYRTRWRSIANAGKCEDCRDVNELLKHAKSRTKPAAPQSALLRLLTPTPCALCTCVRACTRVCVCVGGEGTPPAPQGGTVTANESKIKSFSRSCSSELETQLVVLEMDRRAVIAVDVAAPMREGKISVRVRVSVRQSGRRTTKIEAKKLEK